MTAPNAHLKATMRSHRICVVIPTYNNDGTLGRVIADVLGYCDDVIVVNDGSTDHTAAIIAALGHRIDAVSYGSNRGKGGALKAGFRRAMERGFDYAITIDSDGQHYAADIPAFVTAVIRHPGSLIVGERDLTGVDINGKSTFANKFSNFWFAVQTGRRLRDTQTGYRAYPLRRLRGLSLLTARYEAELELLVLSAWRGIPLVAIPINVYYPPRAQRVSHFRPAADFTRISVLNTVLCGLAVVYGYPAKALRALRGATLKENEFKPFTRKGGQRREAALTLGRLLRSLYGLAYFLFWSMGVFTPLAAVYFRIGRVTERKKERFHRALQWITRSLIHSFPGAAVTTHNPHGETFARPALIICNHQSHLDLPMIMSVHHKLIFLTNDRVWANPFYGSLIHKAEYLPVSAGMDMILPRLRDLRDRGYSIVVFPEGTRSADCSILRFHQGAFHLARELGLDIVPMVLHGAGHYLPKEDFMFRRGHITLRVMKRVPHEPDSDEALRVTASAYRKAIRREYESLATEMETAQYFRPLALYKYAYRGRAVTRAAKRELARLPLYAQVINEGVPPMTGEPLKPRAVRIINSGIGVFALLYALVNKDVDVHAFEESAAEHGIAAGTPSLPANLHLHHPASDGEYALGGMEFDMTYVLLRSGRGGVPSGIGADYITVNI